MSKSRYYVVSDRDVWVVQCASTERAQSTSRDKAMRFAICAAQMLGMRGERTYVCALDDDGRFRTRWTYDRDRHQRTRASAIQRFPMRRSRSGTDVNSAAGVEPTEALSP
jgi:hypothetical protein